MNPTIAEVRLFAGNFAPRAWAFCEGQLLAISSNDALFSILGTTYGGDGRTTFGLPDLRGRAPIGQGTGAGLPHYNLGQRTGTATELLNITQMPPHNHHLNCNNDSNLGDENSPQNHFFGTGPLTGSGPTAGPENTRYAATANAQMNSLAISTVGGGQSHNNMQPSLALHYIICLFGVYPSRN